MKTMKRLERKLERCSPIAAKRKHVDPLPKLVAHLRRHRTGLRGDWIRRIRDARLLTAMTEEEVFSEATAVYDNYVAVLQTGSVKGLKAYARDLSRRIIPRGVRTREVLGIVLLLRDVLARSLFEKYRNDFALLNRVLNAYEPAANRIAETVGVSFVEQRERVIRQQREAIRELSIQEKERKWISRELHDDVGQALTAVLINLTVLGRDGAGAPEILHDRIADMRKQVQHSMDTVHRFARELRPSMLDELGLLPALRSYLRDFAERTGLVVNFDGQGDVESLNIDQKTVLFRIAQESLTNVAKHAEASHVEVSLHRGDQSVRMQIKDNGRSFHVGRQLSGNGKKRLGLLGFQERVELVNGRCDVKSARGKGTTIGVEIPVESRTRSRHAAARTTQIRAEK